VFSVAEHDASHIAYAEPVNKRSAGGNRSDYLNFFAAYLDYVSYVRDNDVFLCNAHGVCNYRIFFQVSELTVYGNEELRFYKSYKKFCFFLTSVSRNVNARIGFVYDVCARTVKFVDDSVYEFFVAGNGGRGQNNEILRSYLNLFMVGICHSVKCGHRFALAARRYDNEFFGVVSVYLVDVDDYSVGYLHISELTCNFKHRYHASAADGDFSAERYRRIDYLLNSVNV